MKQFNSVGRVFFAGALLCIAARVGAAPETTTSFTDPLKPVRAFEEAWAGYVALRDVPPKSVGEMGARARGLARLALDIFEGYPTDPRRWDAAIEIIKTTHGYVYEIVGDPEELGPDAYRRDQAAREAWGAYARALYQQILDNADGLSGDVVRNAIQGYLYRQAMSPGIDTKEWIPTVNEFAHRFPDDPILADLEARLYMGLEQRHPDLLVERLQTLQHSANPAVREFAAAKMLIDVARDKPLEMKFTAVDGREVDLTDMRGKVVLVDFWATWCGPCLAAVPQLKELYAKYRQQGLEIVGISLDQAPSGDKPPAYARSADQLVAFTGERGMSWPNHYDGRYWQNEFAVKYAIKAVPATFLLDRKGRLMATNLRGEELEAAVRRLLAP